MDECMVQSRAQSMLTSIAVLCCAVLCCAVLCCAVLRCAVLCCAAALHALKSCAERIILVKADSFWDMQFFGGGKANNGGELEEG